ncbi:MAG: efflux RND transporter periplasmic adaptor subunit [Roseibium sp.]|uniref:efflux RND transporter periplasmic adaptor subunit n=1 Tax=Roseibium sp. TaxID=1936156 RepID=UPI003D9C3F16
MSSESSVPDTRKTGNGFVKKLGRRLVSLTTFSINVGIAAAAVMIGVTTIQMRAEEKPAVRPAPLVEVRPVQPEHQAGYEVTRSFVGRLEPARRTDLGFELSGTIRAIEFDEGDLVSRGEVIAVLDTRTLEAEKRRQIANRKAAESDRELAALTLKRRQKLRDGGHVSDQILDEARLALSRFDATLDQIDAAIEAIDINLDKSVLTAPFDGSVGERLLDEGATVAPGVPVLRLLEVAKPTVRIGLAPEVVDRLDRNDTFQIRISDRQFQARLSGLRPDLQTSTRTIETLFELDVSDAAPQFGRLAELSLSERIETEGFWVPTAALKEGPRGLWTLLAVVEVPSETGEDVFEIRREAVEVLHADATRSFVRGTISSDTNIVAEGVHRVVVGQQVGLSGGGA